MNKTSKTAELLVRRIKLFYGIDYRNVECCVIGDVFGNSYNNEYCYSISFLADLKKLLLNDVKLLYKNIDPDTKLHSFHVNRRRLFVEDRVFLELTTPHSSEEFYAIVEKANYELYSEHFHSAFEKAVE
jgi:hypothetical protein